MDEKLRNDLIMLGLTALVALLAWFFRGSFVTHNTLRPITAKLWDEIRETQAELKALKAVLEDRERRK